MGYLAVWKVLEEMIADFRQKGLVIPAEVMNDLKSARTMIKILKADMSRGETLQRIEEYLSNVESYVVSEGQKKFGVEYLDEWLERLNMASSQIIDEEEEETSRFISGAPREQKWIRVKTSAELPIERLRALAQESNLLCNVENNGFLLVYGKDEDIKSFVRKITVKHS